MHARPQSYTVELADGCVLSVGICPVSGEPVIFDRDLPSSRMSAFSSTNPPRSSNHSAQDKSIALKCG